MSVHDRPIALPEMGIGDVRGAKPIDPFPRKGRDLRLDFFRGLSLFFIFIDHIPNNFLGYFTLRSIAFSDAAEVFIFISGYTAALVYGRSMSQHGALLATAQVYRRVWQLYVAHIILFVIYIVAISFLARRFMDSELINEFNVAGLVDHATETLGQGLLLKFKPVNLDVLPLYIVLMGFFPPVLWMMLRQPDLTMLASIVLWLLARYFGWNFNAYPAGTWYFDPYCWQVIFIFGSWCALGGAKKAAWIINSKIALYFGVAYLIFALIMTMAGRFPDLGAMFPDWLYSTFNPNDKTFMAPYRFLHFIVIAMLVVRFIPKDWPALEWKGFDPAIVCGQQSLAVFCVGVFLSFVAHFMLTLSSGSVLAQIVISLAGIAIMTIVAYYISWSKRQDKPVPKPAAKPATGASASASA